MQRAKLRVIATNIMLCEKEIRQGKNVKENENKIKRIKRRQLLWQ